LEHALCVENGVSLRSLEIILNNPKFLSVNNASKPFYPIKIFAAKLVLSHTIRICQKKDITAKLLFRFYACNYNLQFNPLQNI
jgi:hypothetical protein